MVLDGLVVVQTGVRVTGVPMVGVGTGTFASVGIGVERGLEVVGVLVVIGLTDVLGGAVGVVTGLVLEGLGVGAEVLGGAGAPVVTGFMVLGICVVLGVGGFVVLGAVVVSDTRVVGGCIVLVLDADVVLVLGARVVGIVGVVPGIVVE